MRTMKTFSKFLEEELLSEGSTEAAKEMEFLLVDAGGGFFKGLPDKDPCSSSAAPTLTTKYISNYTDPASTGKGLLYRCINIIGGGSSVANPAINGANIFIKYCIAYFVTLNAGIKVIIPVTYTHQNIFG